MVTAADVRSYLKPLLDKHDDLALVGRLLVVKPVHHVLRGVLIDRTSSRDYVDPTWFLYHVFGPYPRTPLSYGERLYSRRFKGWRTTRPEIGASLCEEIEEVALPQLRSVFTLEEYVAAVPSTRGGHIWSIDSEQKSLIDLALGDLVSARRLCADKICNRPDPKPKEADVTKAEAAGAKLLCSLLAGDDIEAIVRTLHAWEATNIKALKLDTYWQPTPFPVEAMLTAA